MRAYQEHHLPYKYDCLGLITSRVIARVGDGEMYYISPLSYDQQRTYVRFMMFMGYARRKAEIHSRREKVVPEFVRYFVTDQNNILKPECLMLTKNLKKKHKIDKNCRINIYNKR